MEQQSGADRVGDALRLEEVDGLAGQEGRDSSGFHCDTRGFRSFVESVQAVIARTEDVPTRLRELRPAFVALLSDSDWLPEEFAQPAERGGMGVGVASYLLYRASDGSLSLTSLVVSAGAQTPVHDHLAWGLVGLYRGEQEEEVFRRLDDETEQGIARLALVERRHLSPGDFYELLPPDGDIHRVRCGPGTHSISIHLLGNDVGCVERHVYEPERNIVKPFRSGYLNVPCS